MSGSFAVTRRATLWIPDTGPVHAPGRPHLFIILTEPDSAGMVLTVPVCSRGPKSDATCIIDAGTHSRITKESFAAYYLLNTFSAPALVKQEAAGIIKDEGMLDEKIFALVCAGVEKSRQSPPRDRIYFAKNSSK